MCRNFDYFFVFWPGLWHCALNHSLNLRYCPYQELLMSEW